MKFNFELDYQRQAVEVVWALFRGQEVCQTKFVVVHAGVIRGFTGGESDFGTACRGAWNHLVP